MAGTEGADSTLKVTVGGALRRMRVDAGLSQDRLADALEMDARTYRRLEAGDQRLYLDQVLAAEKACGRPYGYALRLAGLITDPVDVVTSIDADLALTDRWRQMAIAAYASALRQSADERAAAASRSAKKDRNRRS